MSHRQPNPILHTAIIIDDISLLSKHVKMGLPINGKNTKGETPLHCAIEFTGNVDRCYEICALLIDHGADVNATQAQGQTPLHYLCSRRYYQTEVDVGELIDLFVEEGAHLNTQDAHSITPLILAVSANNIAVARKLLKAGADPNAGGGGTKTTLSEAVKNHNTDMMKLLMRHKAKINDKTAILQAIDADRAVILNQLIVDGADLGRLYQSAEETDRENRQLFRCAIEREKTEALECLLDVGIERNMKNFCIQKYFLDMHSTERKMQRYDRKFVILLKHIAVLKVTDRITLSDSMQQFLRMDKKWRERFEQYEEQLARMKSTKVLEDSDFTYFDLLTKRGKVLMNFCSRDILLVMQRKNIEKLFVDFSSSVWRNFRRGLWEKITRDRMKEYLLKLLVPRLSFDVVCYICDYLEVSDLTVFKLETECAQRADPTQLRE